MAVTGVKIYSGDNTQTSVSVTVNETEYTFSGSWTGDTFTGNVTKFALDGMSVTEMSALAAGPFLIKNSLIDGVSLTTGGSTWGLFNVGNGTSVISGSTMNDAYVSNTGRSVFVQNGSSNSNRSVLVVSDSLFTDN